MISGRPATIHHVRICGGARDDHRILPLAPEYHLIQHGPRTSIEALGKRKFEEKYGVDIEAAVKDYRRRYEHGKRFEYHWNDHGLGAYSEQLPPQVL